MKYSIARVLNSSYYSLTLFLFEDSSHLHDDYELNQQNDNVQMDTSNGFEGALQPSAENDCNSSYIAAKVANNVLRGMIQN